MPPPRRLKADLALVAVTFIWGATFVVVKGALADASPLVFILLRFAIAVPLLLFLFGRRARLGRARLWEPGLARAGAVIGFFLWAGFVFQTTGLQYTTPAKSAFITALSVVLVPVLVVVVLRQRPRPEALAGVAAAALGVYFLTVPRGALAIGRGDLLTLVCTLGFAAHIVAVGHYASRHSVAGLAIWQMGVALGLTALAVPLAAASGLEMVKLEWTGRLALALGIAAVLATAVAFSVQTWAQQFTSSTHTALIYSLEPVFAALTSYVAVGERLEPRGWLGAGLILAGVVLAELRVRPGPELPGVPAAGNPEGEERV